MGLNWSEPLNNFRNILRQGVAVTAAAAAATAETEQKTVNAAESRKIVTTLLWP